MMFTIVLSLCFGLFIAFYITRHGIDLSDLMVGIYRCVRAQIKYLRFGKEVPTEEIAKRLTICGSCPFENNGVCMQCGCILAEKARMSTEQCPNDYWNTSEKK